jgi:hypothetical protein
MKLAVFYGLAARRAQTARFVLGAYLMRPWADDYPLLGAGRESLRPAAPTRPALRRCGATEPRAAIGAEP